MRRAISVSLVLILPLALAGCGSTTTSRTVSGTLIGAGGGAARSSSLMTRFMPRISRNSTKAMMMKFTDTVMKVP